MSEPIDPEAYRASLDRMSEIFSTMMVTVDELEGKRCPYKNVKGRCTAQFGCRNQRKPRNPGELRVCGGDDKIDYRSAWESA